jgi:hypothetical protein
MVENHGGTAQFLHSPACGPPLAQTLGQTLNYANVPLPGGLVAVYNSSGLYQYSHSDWLGSARLTSTPSRRASPGLAYAPFGEGYAVSSGWIQFTGNGNVWTQNGILPDNCSGSTCTVMTRYGTPVTFMASRMGNGEFGGCDGFFTCWTFLLSAGNFNSRSVLFRPGQRYVQGEPRGGLRYPPNQGPPSTIEPINPIDQAPEIITTDPENYIPSNPTVPHVLHFKCVPHVGEGHLLKFITSPEGPVIYVASWLGLL